MLVRTHTHMVAYISVWVRAYTFDSWPSSRWTGLCIFCMTIIKKNWGSGSNNSRSRFICNDIIINTWKPTINKHSRTAKLYQRAATSVVVAAAAAVCVGIWMCGCACSVFMSNDRSNDISVSVCKCVLIFLHSAVSNGFVFGHLYTRHSYDMYTHTHTYKLLFFAIIFAPSHSIILSLCLDLVSFCAHSHGVILHNSFIRFLPICLASTSSWQKKRESTNKKDCIYSWRMHVLRCVCV